MKTKKEYWIWYWGVDQSDTSKHSPPLRFDDFNVMKNFSALHSHSHSWIGESYWSSYEKKEVDNLVKFIPSNIHQGHYVYVNGEYTGKVVNLYAYHTVEGYKNKVDKEIEEL